MSGSLNRLRRTEVSNLGPEFNEIDLAVYYNLVVNFVSYQLSRLINML